MRKVFFISLILMSVFLCTSAVVLAGPSVCQDYECAVIGTQYGVVDYIDTECVELCNDGGFETHLDGFCFGCFLYPSTDERHLLGTADTCSGWAGCSVEFRGTSITTKLTLIQDNAGSVLKFDCKPCNDCCL
jgi:hypothetical protein